MGYTHYWRRNTVLPVALFGKFVVDCVKLSEHLPEGIKLGNGLGEGSPVFNSNEVIFNGAEPESYETFHLPKVFKPEKWETPNNGKYFSFCKTARRPYDIMVAGCLFAAQHIFGDRFIFSSDGDEGELQEGYEFWLKVCQPESPAPLIELAHIPKGLQLHALHEQS